MKKYITRIVIDTFKDVFPDINNINTVKSFREMSIDSLELVEYLLILQERFNNIIWPESFDHINFTNLDDIIDYLLGMNVHED